MDIFWIFGSLFSCLCVRCLLIMFKSEHLCTFRTKQTTCTNLGVPQNCCKAHLATLNTDKPVHICVPASPHCYKLQEKVKLCCPGLASTGVEGLGRGRWKGGVLRQGMAGGKYSQGWVGHGTGAGTLSHSQAAYSSLRLLRFIPPKLVVQIQVYSLVVLLC